MTTAVASRFATRWRRLLREPLLHFLLLGALLFGAYGWLHRGLLSSPAEIVVTRGQLEALQAQFARTWKRPPTAQEVDGLVDDWLHEEVLYREGVAMGLDRDDPLVRRRVGQKVEFIGEGPPQAVPTDAELQAWLDAHADRYPIEPRYSLRQVYFDPARHGDGLESDIAAARRTLEAGKAVSSDSTMLPAAIEDVSASEVARVFGKEFAETLEALAVGGWQGPVRSGLGLHLVQVRSAKSARRATVDEVRGALTRDLLQARVQQANRVFYDKLRAKYVVRIDSPAGAQGQMP
jgi:PPIC-type PPIASE domain